MKWKTINLMMVLTSIFVLGAFTGSPASDNVEWNIRQTLQLDETPIDVALSADGRRFFVLTEKGHVFIYSSRAQVEAEIDVGKHVDQIKSGPRGDTLILTSGRKKTVQVVTLDFIQKINTSGSPFKGPADAPVVVAVFDDFQ